MINLSTFETFKTLKYPGAIELNDIELKKLQNILLLILCELDCFCKTQEVSYSLSGGTALGALRHGGFIPWDDDIDINMTRKEFTKFALALESKLAARYTLEVPGETEDYSLLHARLRLKGTVLKTREDVSDEEIGIFIDIFIVENTFDNFFLRHLHGALCTFLGFVCSCRCFYEKKDKYRKIFRNTVSARRVFKIKKNVGFLVSFLSTKMWFKLTNKIYSICKNDRSKFVSIPAGRKHFYGELYERSGFCDTRKMKFEVLQCPVSLDIDNYMRALYGPDYMKIPPPEKREKHIILGLQFPEDVECAE